MTHSDTNKPPDWVKNPTAPEITAFYREQAIELVISQLSATGGGNIAEVVQTPRFMADVELGALTSTKQLAVAARQSLLTQLEASAQSKLYHYGTNEFDSWEEMYEFVMDGYDEDSSTRRDLAFAMERLGPVMQAAGLDGIQDLIQPGNMAKFRIVKPKLETMLGDGESKPADLQEIAQVIADVRDERVTRDQMANKYVASRNGSGLGNAHGYEFMDKRGGILVIRCDSVPLYNLMRRLLGAKVTWHHGTGKETFLSQLTNKKTVKQS